MASLVILLTPVHARADALSWIGVITGIGSTVLSEILYFLALTPLMWVLAALGKILNFLVYPGPITTSSIVQIGWAVTRDFANMFFILILLGIALDFILFNSFGVKKMLPRLLLVALLINFSLPIAGMLIDVASVFTKFFLSKVGDCSSLIKCAFSEAFADTLGLHRLIDGKLAEDPSLANVLVAQNTVLLNVIFAIFLILGTISVFFSLIFMFLTRLGYLYVLLVILPIVLVAYAFPPTSKYFSTWKDSFFKWVMFAPAASFFLYLSLLVLSAATMKDFSDTVSETGNRTYFFDTIFTYIIAWTFMGGSLVAANQMGIKTAGALAAVEATLRGKIKNLRNQGFGKIDDKFGITKKAMQYTAKVPFVGSDMTKGIAGIATKLSAAKKEAAELTKGEQELINNGSEETVTSLIQSYGKGIPDQQAKIGKMIMLAKDKFKIKYAKGEKDSKGKEHEEGETNFEAITALKRIARAKAKAVNDITTVKAIDQSDLTIGEEAINVKYGFNPNAKKGEEFKNPKAIDLDTGKTVEEAHARKMRDLYGKINFAKEDFDESLVNDKFIEKMVQYGAMSQEKFKQAQRSGNLAIVREFRKYMKDDKKKDHKMEHLMNEQNAAFRKFLISSPALNIIGDDFEKDLKKLRHEVLKLDKNERMAYEYWAKESGRNKKSEEAYETDDDDGEYN